MRNEAEIIKRLDAIEQMMDDMKAEEYKVSLTILKIKKNDLEWVLGRESK